MSANQPEKTIDEVLKQCMQGSDFASTSEYFQEAKAALSAMVGEIIHGKPLKDGEYEMLNIMIASEHVVQDKRAAKMGFKV